MSLTQTPCTCYITHIEIVNSLIKIWVQHETVIAEAIERDIKYVKQTLLPHTVSPSSYESIKMNDIFLAMFSDGEYYRCTVEGMNKTKDKFNVMFIDFGNTSFVGLKDLKQLRPEDKIKVNALDFPAQATPYYLYGVALLPGQMKDNDFEWFKSLTLYSELSCIVHDGSVKLITVRLNQNVDLSELIVQKNFGILISPEDQAKVVESGTAAYSWMSTGVTLPDVRRPPPGMSILASHITSVPPPSLNIVQTPLTVAVQPAQSSLSLAPSALRHDVRKPTMQIYQPPHQKVLLPTSPTLVRRSPFQSKGFNVGETYEAYVSHVEDGPLQFYLQMKSYADSVLPLLNINMNKISLQTFSSAVTHGTLVVAMQPQDKALKRAMVLSAGSNMCRVFYIDFGAFEELPYTHVFHLPSSLGTLSVEEAATAFALVGVTEATESCKAEFKRLVLGRTVGARVAAGGPIRRAELFLERCEDGTWIGSVSDRLAALCRPPLYPRSAPPTAPTAAVVSHFESATQVYLQLGGCDAGLEKAVASAWAIAVQLAVIPPIAAPVLALYDGAPYRALIMGTFPAKSTATVLYVDYGNTDQVGLDRMREASRDLVSGWPVQAVECSLSGAETADKSALEAILEKLRSEMCAVTVSIKAMLSGDRLAVEIYGPDNQNIVTMAGPATPQLQPEPVPSSPTVVQAVVKEGEVQKPVREEVPKKYSKERFKENVSDNRQDDYATKKDGNTYSRPPKESGSDIGFVERRNRFGDDKTKDSRYGDERNRENQYGDKRRDNRFPEDRNKDTRYTDDNRDRRYGDRDNRYGDENRGNRYGEDNKTNRYGDDHKGHRFGEESKGHRFGDESKGHRFGDDHKSHRFGDESKGHRFGEESKGNRFGDDSKGHRFNDESKGNRFGDDSKGHRYGDEHKANRFGDETKSNRYNDDSKGHRYNDDSKGNRYGDDSKGNRYGDDSKSNRYGDETKGARYGDEIKGARYGDDYKANRYGDEAKGSRFKDENKGRYGERSNRFGDDKQKTDQDDWRKDNRDFGRESRGFRDDKFAGKGGDQRNRNRDVKKDDWNEKDRSALKGFEHDDRTSTKYDHDTRGKKGNKDSDSRHHKFEHTVDTKKLEEEEIWDSPQTESPQTAPCIKQFPPWRLEPGSTHKVLLSHFENPDKFFVRSVDREEELNGMRELIDKDALTGARKVVRPALGASVLARFPDDGLLYRAVIIKSIDENSLQVLYTDYGNSCIVARDEVFYARETLASTPVLAALCQLAGVRPLSTSWPAKAVTPFEANEMLLLKVDTVKCVDGQLVHQVRMKSNGESIGKQLINSGIAKDMSDKSGTSPSIPTSPQLTTPAKIDAVLTGGEKWVERAELLVGQFLRAVVVSAVDSDTALVRLEAAQLVAPACVPSPSSLLGRLVILHVNSIVNDRFTVTVYADDGTLIGGERSDRVNPVVPAPVVRSATRAAAVHIEKTSDGATVFLQRVADRPIAEALLEDLFNHYDTMPPSPTPRDGALVAAKSHDGNWYRAVVLANTGRSISVKYLDYGNSEMVTETHPLDKAFFGPELVLETQFQVKMLRADLNKEVGEGEWTIKLVRSDVHRWGCDLISDDGQRLMDKLISSGGGEDFKESPFLEVNSVIGSRLLAGDKAAVCITHVESAGLVWAQLAEHVGTVETLQEALQTMEFSNDETCGVFATRYTADNLWYRAVNADPADPGLVRFIDYGNTDHASERKELSHQMKKPRSGYAVPLSICARPVSKNWSPEALAIVEAFVDRDQLEAKVLSVTYRTVVDLCAGDESLCTKLVAAGQAVHDNLIPSAVTAYEAGGSDVPVPVVADPVPVTLLPAPSLPGKCTVFITHVESPTCIYIQMETDSARIENMDDELVAAESFGEAGPLVVGQLVAALFAEDGRWYRATILDPITLSVHFTDYGNTAIATSLRELPPDLRAVPPLARAVSLGVNDWPTNSIDVILNAAEHGSLELSLTVISAAAANFPVVSLHKPDGTSFIDIIKTGNVPSAVSLPTIDGQLIHVEQRLLKSCSNVSIVFAECLDKFFITLPEDEANIQQVANTLVDMSGLTPVDQLLVGSLVAAQSPDDEQWYRGKILQIEPLNVSYVDYGNEGTPTEIKQLPNDLYEIPPLAYECRLHKPEGALEWTAEAEDAFYELTTNSDAKYSLIVVVPGCPAEVSLSLEGVNIIKHLGSTGNAEQEVTVESVNDCLEKPDQSPTMTDSTETSAIADDDSAVCKTTDDATAADQNSSTSERIACYISHFTSCQDFYVQYVSSEANLNTIIDQLALIEGEDSAKCAVGRVIVALYPVDYSWYRAKITSVGPPLIVKFIDFGNISAVEKVATLPEELRSLPPLARHCSFLLSPAAKSLEGYVNSQLSELVSFSSDPFYLRVIRESQNNEPATVELTLEDGSDLVDFIMNKPVGFFDDLSEPTIENNDATKSDHDVPNVEGKILPPSEEISSSICEPAAEIDKSSELSPIETSVAESSQIKDTQIEDNTNKQTENVMAVEEADDSSNPSVNTLSLISTAEVSAIVDSCEQISSPDPVVSAETPNAVSLPEVDSSNTPSKTPEKISDTSLNETVETSNSQEDLVKPPTELSVSLNSESLEFRSETQVQNETDILNEQAEMEAEKLKDQAEASAEKLNDQAENNQIEMEAEKLKDQAEVKTEKLNDHAENIQIETEAMKSNETNDKIHETVTNQLLTCSEPAVAIASCLPDLKEEIKICLEKEKLLSPTKEIASNELTVDGVNEQTTECNSKKIDEIDETKQDDLIQNSEIAECCVKTEDSEKQDTEVVSLKHEEAMDVNHPADSATKEESLNLAPEVTLQKEVETESTVKEIMNAPSENETSEVVLSENSDVIKIDEKAVNKNETEIDVTDLKCTVASTVEEPAVNGTSDSSRVFSHSKSSAVDSCSGSLERISAKNTSSDNVKNPSESLVPRRRISIDEKLVSACVQGIEI